MFKKKLKVRRTNVENKRERMQTKPDIVSNVQVFKTEKVNVEGERKIERDREREKERERKENARRTSSVVRPKRERDERSAWEHHQQQPVCPQAAAPGERRERESTRWPSSRPALPMFANEWDRVSVLIALSSIRSMSGYPSAELFTHTYPRYSLVSQFFLIHSQSIYFFQTHTHFHFTLLLNVCVCAYDIRACVWPVNSFLKIWQILGRKEEKRERQTKGNGQSLPYSSYLFVSTSIPFFHTLRTFSWMKLSLSFLLTLRLHT